MSRTKDDKNSQIAEFVHRLFSYAAYDDWIKTLESREVGKWYSLVVELSRVGCPLDDIKKLGENVIERLVFCTINSPSFKRNNQYMIIFQLSERTWHRIVYYSPSPI